MTFTEVIKRHCPLRYQRTLSRFISAWNCLYFSRLNLIFEICFEDYLITGESLQQDPNKPGVDSASLDSRVIKFGAKS